MGTEQIIATLIFLLVMVAIISEKVNRCVASLLGSLLMILFKILPLESGLSHIDFNTISVLIGMMLFVAVIKNSGLFEYIAILFALTGATIMLIIGKQDINEILSNVEWFTILFFTDLFVIVGGLEEVGLINKLAKFLIEVIYGHLVLTMLIILWLSAIVSSFLDNIPFITTLIPLILTMETQGLNITPLWWSVSLGACLGGNGTLVGASANIVLARIVEKHGYPLSFKEYFKFGFPLMILSIIISTVYLLVMF